MMRNPGCPVPDLDLATRLFNDIREVTRDAEGVTRASYSREENVAHEIVRAAALDLGLTVWADDAGNLYMSLAGERDGEAPYVVGSHLDSVRRGGSYDGTAGVIGGLAIASGYRKRGTRPPRSVTIMATRAEESMWFSCSYIGSRAALGLLQVDDIENVRRSDTGRSLRDHAGECGFDIGKMCASPPRLHRDSIQGFFEIHIEQGPVLEERKVPVGIVTGIRGNFRYRSASCVGEYGHCGTVPRHLRHDAVIAVVDLIARLDHSWEEYEKSGKDVAVTTGVLHTDPGQHGVSKIAGHAVFAIDVRSLSSEVLSEIELLLKEEVRLIENKRGVIFDLGPRSEARPAVVDKRLRQALISSARRADLPFVELASGAGHDAAMFAHAGVPSALIFVRNANGSHNPREAMEVADLGLACELIVDMLEAERTK